MSTDRLSEQAKEARRAYFRGRYKSAPDKHKAYVCHMWEKKAQQFFGTLYIPPDREGVLSDQAAELRRRYYSEYRKTHETDRSAYMREYRKNHKEKLSQYQRDYWERKGKKV